MEIIDDEGQVNEMINHITLEAAAGNIDGLIISYWAKDNGNFMTNEVGNPRDLIALAAQIFTHYNSAVTGMYEYPPQEEEEEEEDGEDV